MAIFGHSVLSHTYDFSESLHICDKVSQNIIWTINKMA